MFARSPVLGAVKTRLAAELGDAAALAIYRALAEQVMLAVRDAGVELVIAHTPSGAGPVMRGWLGSDLRFEPQLEDGDLGARMAGAIGRRLAEGATRVVVIGTDAPAVDASTIAAALAALTHCDVVLGPTLDGGYYLIGMTRLHAALFADMPWSSDAVLRVSLDRAHAAGLRVSMLAMQRDVDTAADWQSCRDAYPALADSVDQRDSTRS